MERKHTPGKFHKYAIKYLDENGFVASYGYAAMLDQIEYKSGDIVTIYNGTRILIDYEL